MKLIDVYEHPDAVDTLYRLLGERLPHENISHRVMPDLASHRAFVWNRPYTAWYLIEEAGGIVGATYLSKADEIGIWIFLDQRRKGYAAEAVKMLMGRHPRPRYLANVNPENSLSKVLFRRLGFKHIQETFSYEP